MSGVPIPFPLVYGDATIESQDTDVGFGHVEHDVEGLARQCGGVHLEVLHPVLNLVTGDAEVLLFELLRTRQHRVTPQRVLQVEHFVEAAAQDHLRGPGFDALQQELVTAEEPRHQRRLRQIRPCRARR